MVDMSGWRRAGCPECGLSLQPSLRGFDSERRPLVTRCVCGATGAPAARRQYPLFEILRCAQNDN